MARDSGSSACSSTNHISTSAAKKRLPSKYIIYLNYFYREVIFYLQRTYESAISTMELVAKEDLDLVNHLSG